MSDPIIDILASEQLEPSARVRRVCENISARHEARVLAFIYYGSSLRDMDNPDKMLDFYVIVDSYRKTHKNPIRAALNALIPPAVYYHEMEHEGAPLSTCKYSIMSIKAFENRCSPQAFLSMTWGRFAQPCVILMPVSQDVQTRLFKARRAAIKHFAAQTAPLFAEPVTALDFWARGFQESYRTELRPESSGGRSREIVERYQERYGALMSVLYSDVDAQGRYVVSQGSKNAAKFKWFMRRMLGKPLGGIRVLNSAATFDGGLEYVLRKLQRHSGVTIDVTPAQRRHPILWSPVLAWKLYRKDAFR